MAVTALSVAISCSRSSGSPISLVTIPEVMIITRGCQPPRRIHKYSRRGQARRKKTEAWTEKDRRRVGSAGREEGTGRVTRGLKVKDSDIDRVLEPGIFPTLGRFLLLSPLFLAVSAMGGTRWPLLVGLERGPVGFMRRNKW